MFRYYVCSATHILCTVKSICITAIVLFLKKVRVLNIFFSIFKTVILLFKISGNKLRLCLKRFRCIVYCRNKA